MERAIGKSCIVARSTHMSHPEGCVIRDAQVRIEELERERDEVLNILRGEKAIAGAFGRVRLWGALDQVLDVRPTEDEIDQIMRLLNANSRGIDTAALEGEE